MNLPVAISARISCSEVSLDVILEVTSTPHQIRPNSPSRCIYVHLGPTRSIYLHPLRITKCHTSSHHRGHRVDGVWVVGGVERTDERKCFLVTVQRRDAFTMETIITTYVKPGSIIHTDFWRSYNGITEWDMEYTHRPVNHSLHFVWIQIELIQTLSKAPGMELRFAAFLEVEQEKLCLGFFLNLFGEENIAQIYILAYYQL